MTGKFKIKSGRTLALSIVTRTDANPAMEKGWLQVMKLASPKIHVVAEDVQKGKPDPACYELGIQRLSLQPATGAAILVIEGLLPLLFLLLLLHLPLPENASHPRSRVSGC